jgi:phosphoribosyl 1,2-cyclic phosphodiesterase
VKKTFLFHHDPSHNDEKMDLIAEEVSKLREGVRPAIEGETIAI